MATAVKTRRKGPVYLRFDDGRVFVSPEDYNNFVVEARRAVEALRDACEVDEWVRHFFDEYVPFIHCWCQERANSISACYFSLSSGPSQKVFVVSAREYDLALGREISQLELTLMDKGFSSDVIQIPFGDEDDLRTFFDPDHSILIYAKT